MIIQDYGRPYKPGDVTEQEIRDELAQMEDNPSLDTRLKLSKEEEFSLKALTFQEKHVVYLKQHPKINPNSYLANLKTMLKIRK
jgi:hypothetical protein